MRVAGDQNIDRLARAQRQYCCGIGRQNDTGSVAARFQHFAVLRPVPQVAEADDLDGRAADFNRLDRIIEDADMQGLKRGRQRRADVGTWKSDIVIAEHGENRRVDLAERAECLLIIAGSEKIGEIAGDEDRIRRDVADPPGDARNRHGVGEKALMRIRERREMNRSRLGKTAGQHGFVLDRQQDAGLDEAGVGEDGKGRKDEGGDDPAGAERLAINEIKKAAAGKKRKPA